MNLLQLYQDYNIQHSTEGHKHCRPGWANTPCPFCTGNPGLHLGYHLTDNYYYCWRCGHHAVPKVLSKILGVTQTKVRQLIREYKGTVRTKETKVIITRKPYKLPSGIIPLTARQRKYLISREFDPDHLIHEWNLMGAGPISVLDGINYKHRILAPIYWNGEQVSFQTRLARHVKKKELKYMACPKARETIDHKHILYGKQNEWKNTGICVEGITDVWRLGVNSFATFGIKFTPFQIRIIANQFERIAVVFDDERQAQTQADKLVKESRFRGVDAFKIQIKGDPGSMTQSEADYLVKTIF